MTRLTARINAIPVLYKLAAVAIAAGCASYLGGIS